MKITIDAGHTKDYNRGVDKTYFEGNAMFYLAGFLKDELEKYNGVEVLLTRKKIEDYLELDERAKVAGDNNCDVFLSLHSNAFLNEGACGVSIYRSVKRNGSAELAYKLANAAVGVMRPITGNTYFRGGEAATRIIESSGNDYYGVIRESVKYACVNYSYLLEHGFHTNEKECAFLNNNDNLKALAVVEANVLAEYFGLKLKTGGKKQMEMVVDTIGVRVRASLDFNGKTPTGKVLTLAKPGQAVKILGFVDGIQPDGYQWIKSEFNGAVGYSQYDSKCYWIREVQ